MKVATREASETNPTARQNRHRSSGDSHRLSDRALTFAPSVGITIAIVAGVAAPATVRDIAAWPLAVGGLTFGMLHGAADWHLIRQQPSPRKVLAIYMLILFAAVGWWTIHAWSAIVAFLGLTAWHFADQETDRYRSARPWTRVGLMVTHGMIVVGLPFVIDTERSIRFLRLVSDVGMSPMSWMTPPLTGSLQFDDSMLGSVSLLVSVALILVTVAGVAMTSVRLPPHDRKRWRGEQLILIIAACVLPPAAMIGVYLLGWHAPRHYEDLFARSSASRAMWMDSMWFHVPAIVTVAGLTWFAMQRGTPSPVIWIVAAATVLVYLFVTPPHHWLGWYLDRNR